MPNFSPERYSICIVVQHFRFSSSSRETQLHPCNFFSCPRGSVRCSSPKREKGGNFRLPKRVRRGGGAPGMESRAERRRPRRYENPFIEITSLEWRRRRREKGKGLGNGVETEEAEAEGLFRMGRTLAWPVLHSLSLSEEGEGKIFRLACLSYSALVSISLLLLLHSAPNSLTVFWSGMTHAAAKKCCTTIVAAVYVVCSEESFPFSLALCRASYDCQTRIARPRFF